MKFALFVSLSLLVPFSMFGGLVVRPGNVNVVVENTRRGTAFAAEELTNLLHRALGSAPTVGKKPVDGKVNIFLGDGDSAAAAGLRSADMPYDAFAVKIDSVADRIYIVGEDTTYGAFMRNPAEYAATPRYPHATVFGVYDLLERFFDCRFFFAGPLGTLIPQRDLLELPDIAYTNAPANVLRSYYYVIDSADKAAGVGARELYNRNWMYHRLETQTIPHTHGTRHFKYMERFADSHPEYFALKADGKTRCNREVVGDDHSVYGHLCWTSAITNEMYADVRSYLSGEAASVRGIPGSSAGSFAWGRNCQQLKYVDIQPNDAYPGCYCENCLALRGDGDAYSTAIIWGATCGIARRLLDDGIAGYVTQMSYGSYNAIPDFDIPTNVLVMVAKVGPFSKYDSGGKYVREQQDIRDWSGKLGRKVMIWNYELKYGATNLKNVPQVCPHAWGDYYKEIAPYVFGHFAEAETDRWFFNHLNYYIYGKIAWDPSLSVDELLDDYYRRMYGAAADEVRGFFEDLETVWLSNVVSRIEETDIGPVTRPPSEYQLWNEVYDDERVERWRATLDRARVLAAGDPDASARLALCRSEMFDRMDSARREYLDQVSVERELAHRAMHPAETWANLVDNGDFETGLLGGSNSRFLGRVDPDPRRIRDDTRLSKYTYSWYVDSNFSQPCVFPLTNGIGVAGGRCAYLAGNGTRRNICQYLPTLESNHAYRVSLFLKGDGLVNPSTGGFNVTINDRINRTFPATAGFTGTFDWIHYSFEFTTHEQTNDGNHVPYIRLVLTTNTFGTAFVDGLRIVDLDALRKKEAQSGSMMMVVSGRSKFDIISDKNGEKQ